MRNTSRKKKYIKHKRLTRRKRLTKHKKTRRKRLTKHKKTRRKRLTKHKKTRRKRLFRQTGGERFCFGCRLYRSQIACVGAAPRHHRDKVCGTVYML